MRVHYYIIYVSSGKRTERPKYYIDLPLNVYWKVPIFYYRDFKGFLPAIYNNRKLVLIVWMDFLLIKKKAQSITLI